MNALEKLKKLVSPQRRTESVERHKVAPANWRKFTIPALMVLALTIPLTVFMAQRVQDFRQRAAEINPPTATAPTVTSVVATASPVSMETSCPGKITTRGYITTNGPATVTYTWLRSDGATAPTQTITFAAAGTQAVTTTWQLGGNGNTYNNWQALKIITPNPLESNKATFTLACRQAVGAQVTAVDVTASPLAIESKACPATITFTGSITTNGPQTVAYQWQRNDGAISAVKNITFTAAGTQQVSTTWQLGSNTSANFNPYNGWESLKILSPNVAQTGQARFKLTCLQPSIKITAPANNTSYPAGTIPLLTISAEAFHPAGISYVTFVGNGHGCWSVTSTTSTFTCTNGFKYVESGDVQIVATAYPKDGSSPIVSAPITIKRSTASITPTGRVPISTPTGQVCAQVLTPARNTTTGACTTFPNSCIPSGWVKDTACTGAPMNPTTTKVTSVTAAANPTTSTTATCPALITFTGNITVDGPATVAYKWLRSDNATDTPKTLTFTTAGTKTVTDTWTLGAANNATFNPFNGWEQLEIITPNSLKSSQAKFALTCTPTPTGDQPPATPTPTPTRTPTPTIAVTDGPSGPPSPSTSLTIAPSLTETPTDAPTATLTPTQPITGTYLSFSLLLHGIGASGDNQLPKPPQCQRTNGEIPDPEDCLSNQDPNHPEREVTIEIINDKEVKTTTGTVIYDSSTGSFRGSVALDNSIASGVYLVKVLTPKYLKRQVPNFVTLKNGEGTTIPELSFISSDIDGDNRLTILDYNIIIGCYTVPGIATSCDSDEAERGDVNDDGKNDEFDENLFRRELKVLNGD